MFSLYSGDVFSQELSLDDRRVAMGYAASDLCGCRVLDANTTPEFIMIKI